MPAYIIIQINKSSVVYVQKCRDRNVPRPKRPGRVVQTEKSCLA